MQPDHKSIKSRHDVEEFSNNVACRITVSAYPHQFVVFCTMHNRLILRPLSTPRHFPRPELLRTDDQGRLNIVVAQGGGRQQSYKVTTASSTYTRRLSSILSTMAGGIVLMWRPNYL